MTETRRSPVYAVVLAGGSGTRLWPLARTAKPKQFLNLLKRESLFQQACRRGALLAGRRRVLVVGGRAHLHWIRRQAPWVSPARIITEGAGRNTAASLALAGLWIRARGRDGMMIAVSSDHWIGPSAAFRHDIRKAVAVARRPGALVTLGVPARAADTGFGYIRPAGGGAQGAARRVESFIEKPSPAVARRLVRGGRHLWNTGIFVWQASSLLAALERWRPGLARAAARAAPSRSAGPWRISSRAMRRIESVPIDKAVLERAEDVYVVRATFEWADLGTWNTLASRLRIDRYGNRSLGRAIVIDSSGCVTVGLDGLTTLVGVRDLVVVRDRTAVLVCARDSVQRVREAQRLLRGGLAAYA